MLNWSKFTLLKNSTQDTQEWDGVNTPWNFHLRNITTHKKF